MQAFLRSIPSDDLFAVAVLGGEPIRDQVEHELDRRATAAMVGRILNDAKRVDALAARESAGAPAAA